MSLLSSSMIQTWGEKGKKGKNVMRKLSRTLLLRDDKVATYVAYKNFVKWGVENTHIIAFILWPNACVVPPLPRPVRQESANTATETFRAGNYVKITARGSGQYQRFVSVTYPLPNTFSQRIHPYLSA